MVTIQISRAWSSTQTTTRIMKCELSKTNCRLLTLRQVDTLSRRTFRRQKSIYSQLRRRLNLHRQPLPLRTNVRYVRDRSPTTTSSMLMSTGVSVERLYVLRRLRVTRPRKQSLRAVPRVVPRVYRSGGSRRLWKGRTKTGERRDGSWRGEVDSGSRLCLASTVFCIYRVRIVIHSALHCVKC